MRILYNKTMKSKKWSNEDLKRAVRESTSFRQVLLKLNLKMAGGNYETIKRYIRSNNLNIEHFRGKTWNKGLTGLNVKPKVPIELILVKSSNFQSYKLKNRLIKNNVKFPKCENCGWSKKAKDGRIPIELHHINGDKYDNRLENLIILCPNCHSLEENYRGRNIKI